uniref:Uncharacterized protein n=1 Tax=viral metagenome TaxID=1070528 RepID=A0A6C0IWH3_9ZZZZ
MWGSSGIEPESCAPKAHILPLNYDPVLENQGFPNYIAPSGTRTHAFL